MSSPYLVLWKLPLEVVGNSLCEADSLEAAVEETKLFLAHIHFEVFVTGMPTIEDVAPPPETPLS